MLDVLRKYKRCPELMKLTSKQKLVMHARLGLPLIRFMASVFHVSSIILQNNSKFTFCPTVVKSLEVHG